MLDNAPGIPTNTRYFGALVPHAGWVCSGQVAADGIAGLRQGSPSVDVVVIFGAVHTIGIDYGAMDDHARWWMPSGLSDVATDLQERIVASGGGIEVDGRAHQREHAIEVLLPMVQQAWVGVPILPIEVPPADNAVAIGSQVARVLREAGKDAVFLASSDLTHYGPGYDFVPAGVGVHGVQWAMRNDQRLLDLIRDLRAEEVVRETRANCNACGGGAIAAMMAACIEWGATRSLVIKHTNSHEVLQRTGRESAENAVGYAAAMIG